MPSALSLLALVIATYFGIMAFQERPIAHPPGVLIASEPIQVNTNGSSSPSPLGPKISMFRLATYELTARVLAKDKYRFDTGATYVPWDLALGWQEMSDSSLLDRLKIWQSHRFYFVQWDQPLPLDRKRIFETSANVHLIPAYYWVDEAIAKARVGDLIHLKGHLVRLERKDGWKWKSSLLRTDTGAGSCELMYVEEVKIL